MANTPAINKVMTGLVSNPVRLYMYYIRLPAASGVRSSLAQPYRLHTGELVVGWTLRADCVGLDCCGRQLCDGHTLPRIIECDHIVNLCLCGGLQQGKQTQSLLCPSILRVWLRLAP